MLEDWKMQKLLSSKVSLSLIALLTMLNAFAAHGYSQVKIGDNSPRKIDEFEYLVTDDEGARLDAFDVELKKEPQSRGYIISYNERNVPPGAFLRRIYGDRHYLIDFRALEPSRIVVVNGGYREKFRTELWLVPSGASPPKPTPTVFDVADRLPLKFDHECLICEQVVFIDLPIFREGLEYYAEALKARPKAHARIVIHANKPHGATKLLALARSTLISKHRIEPSRIIIARSKRLNNLGLVEFWIVP